MVVYLAVTFSPSLFPPCCSFFIIFFFTVPLSLALCAAFLLLFFSHSSRSAPRNPINGEDAIMRNSHISSCAISLSRLGENCDFLQRDGHEEKLVTAAQLQSPLPPPLRICDISAVIIDVTECNYLNGEYVKTIECVLFFNQWCNIYQKCDREKWVTVVISRASARTHTCARTNCKFNTNYNYRIV